jgi:hypothetical protein
LHLRFEEIAKDQQFTDKNIFKDTKFLFFAALLLNGLLLHFTNIFNLFIPRKVEINLISKEEIFLWIFHSFSVKFYQEQFYNIALFEKFTIILGINTKIIIYIDPCSQCFKTTTVFATQKRPNKLKHLSLTSFSSLVWSLP